MDQLESMDFHHPIKRLRQLRLELRDPTETQPLRQFGHFGAVGPAHCHHCPGWGTRALHSCGQEALRFFRLHRCQLHAPSGRSGNWGDRRDMERLESARLKVIREM